MNYDKNLIAVLKKLQKVLPGELAHIVLTGKAELALRDKVMYLLGRHLKTRGIYVTREWYHADLAVVKSRQAIAELETKYMYSFDGLHDRTHHLLVAAKRDLHKRRTRTKRGVERYALIFAAYPHARIPDELKRVVKYRGCINVSFRKYKTSKAIAKKCDKSVRSYFSKNCLVMHSGVLRAGSWAGVKVDVLYWLVKRHRHEK